ncbi:MAG: hypothetical protein ACR2NX_14190 [Chthoniobacterales bacterium]
MKILSLLVSFVLVSAAAAQSPNDAASPLPSPSIPAGPQPTATINQVTASPQPTAVVTPLPSASPAGTQPRVENTVAPSPTPAP